MLVDPLARPREFDPDALAEAHKVRPVYRRPEYQDAPKGEQIGLDL